MKTKDYIDKVLVEHHVQKCKEESVRAMLSLAQGHPRSIEFVCNVCLTKEPMSFRTMFQKSIEKLSTRYQSRIRYECFQAALSDRKEIHVDDLVDSVNSLTFGDAISQGIFDNCISGRSIPYIPPLLFYLHFTIDDIQKRLLECEDKSSADKGKLGYAFEVHHAAWEAISRLLWRNDYYTIEDLYISRRNLLMKPNGVASEIVNVRFQKPSKCIFEEYSEATEKIPHSKFLNFDHI